MRVLRQLFGKKLQRHGTVEPRILGFVHNTHPSAAELLEDAVVRDRLRIE